MRLALTRRLGALSLLAVGAVHLQQYLGADYQAIPTIGWLFLLNAIGSGLVGLALLAPLERAGTRGDLGACLLSIVGVSIAAGSLVALFVSESSSLFGFAESGYRTAIVLSIVAEALTALLLTVAAVGHGAHARHGRRDTPTGTRWHPRAGGIQGLGGGR